MLKHIVLLSFRADLSPMEIQQKMQVVSDLRKSIPQIIYFSPLQNMSKEGLEQGFWHGFIVGFKDEDDRDVFLFHQEHVRVAHEVIYPALSNGKNSIIVFDYFDKDEALSSQRNQSSLAFTD